MLKIAEYNKKTGKKIELKELEDYGFEIGYDYQYEKMHVDNYYNGSKSVVIDEETKEIFIVCYNFSYDETNGTQKIVTKEQYIKKYIKDLITDGYIEKAEE